MDKQQIIYDLSLNYSREILRQCESRGIDTISEMNDKAVTAFKDAFSYLNSLPDSNFDFIKSR